MATKKVGALIKEARTAAGLTQEQLARKVTGAAAADVGKVERGEADFTQAQLKQVAKACGVTQSSLLDAPKNLREKASTTKATAAAKASGAKKTTTAKKSTTAKKTASAKKTTTTKKATSTTKKAASATASSGSSMKVSATEKRLVELFRAADTQTKQAAMAVLKGDASIEGAPDTVGEFVGSLIDGAIGAIGKR